jgi:hypothetical protein
MTYMMLEVPPGVHVIEARTDQGFELEIEGKPRTACFLSFSNCSLRYSLQEKRVVSYSSISRFTGFLAIRPTFRTRLLVNIPTNGRVLYMNVKNTSWLLLIASLPTSGATARMRLWRAIKALGCVPLRDGAYLLPRANGHEVALIELAEQTNAEGGQAWVVDVAPRLAEDEAAFVALFDRSEEYSDFVGRLSHARKQLASQTPAEVAKTVKRLRRDLESLRRIDFFPDTASLGAEAAWSDFEDAANAVLSPDEPHAAVRSIPRLSIKDYQGRTWATRRHLWVDRVASAWLIRRFIDRKAEFLWLDSPAHCPKDALGFDFDEATFTHIGDKVSFEVLLAAFGLEEDQGLAKLGSLVHALDVGGHSSPEAIGFEAILSGARSRLDNDDALLNEIGAVLDSLYAYFRKESTA